MRFLLSDREDFLGRKNAALALYSTHKSRDKSGDRYSEYN